MHALLKSGTLITILLLGGCGRQDEPATRSPLSDAQPREQTPSDAREQARKSLGPGDVAPSLAGVKWVKGEGVHEFEKGTIYVIDFMATWCGPCIELMPHMSDLAERHRKDKVKVVGICIWESSHPLGNHASYEEKVRAFAQKRAKELRYDAGYEGDDAPLSVSYMRAAGRISIPSVFVVGRDGRIAWIGHPSMDLDAVVAQLVAGTFDAEKHAMVIREREANRIKGMQLARKLQDASLRKEHERAVSLCDEILALDPVMFAPTRVSKFKVALTGMKDATLAERVARDAMDFPAPIPSVLAGIAAVILLDPDAPQRNLPLASSLLDKVEDTTTPATDPQLEPLIARLQSLLPRVHDAGLRMQIEAMIRAHREPPAAQPDDNPPTPLGGG